LDLYNNQLSSIPTEIGNLVNLSHLDLDNNQLVSLPTEIGNLVNLSHLDLNNNNWLTKDECIKQNKYRKVEILSLLDICIAWCYLNHLELTGIDEILINNRNICTKCKNQVVQYKNKLVYDGERNIPIEEHNLCKQCYRE